MIEALQKTALLILLICLGLALRSKFKNKTEINGIKEIVLSVALPATVFTALMGVKISFSLLIYPLVILAFNFFIYYSLPLILPFFGVSNTSSAGSTLRLLLPSLAPGLSSFPFINEFLGESTLAMAAMGDIGNKFFALNFLYFVALKLYMKNNKTNEIAEENNGKKLLYSLIKEPINVVMLLAIILLSFGMSMKDLPSLISDFFAKASSLMTPLVLIYIGLAVQFKGGKIKLVSSILFFRAGITMLFSLIVIKIFNITEANLILLAIVLPLSSCSFWPFAHISGINVKEENMEMPKEKRTFDINLAILILAFSLPFSTILVMGILASGSTFTHSYALMGLSILFLFLGLAPHVISYFQKAKKRVGRPSNFLETIINS